MKVHIDPGFPKFLVGVVFLLHVTGTFPMPGLAGLFANDVGLVLRCGMGALLTALSPFPLP